MIEEPASHYRSDIDGLRALAVLAVVAFHGYPQQLRGGFVGVDIFFVISGYLISRLILADIQAERFSIGRFYARRIRRIFPALTLALLACTIAAWAFLLPDDWHNFGRDLFASSAFAANIALAFERSNYFAPGQYLRPLLHLWSLGVEEQFYFVWPLLLFLLRKRTVRTTMAVLAAIAMMSFAANVIFVWKHQAMTFYLPVSRVWELAIGSLLAVSGAKLSGWGAEAVSWVGIALCLGAIAFTRETHFPGFGAIAPAVGPLLLIAGGPSAWVNRRVLATRAAVAIGLISYPLYLWHWPLFSAARFSSDALTYPWWQVPVCVTAAFILATLTYRYVETPIRTAPVTSAKLRVVCAVMVLIALAGAAAARRLIPPRLHGPDVDRALDAAKDWDYPHNYNFGRLSGFQHQDVPGALPGVVMFAGDSHVEQFWPRLEVLAKRGAPTLRFVTYGGCPPVHHIEDSRGGETCDDFVKFTTAEALRPEVTTVVYSGSWTAYVQPQFGRARIDRSMAEFSRTLESLRQHGRHVFVILSTPRSGLFNPRNMISWKNAKLDPPAPLTIDQLRPQPFYANAIVRAAAEAGGATVIDPLPWLCPNGLCPAYSPANGPVFSDSNHMRPWYVRERALFLDEIIARHSSRRD